MREHRLYQSDWLMRFYGFAPERGRRGRRRRRACFRSTSIPKLAWALKFRDIFPLDVNRAPRETLLRVPGLGVKAVDALLASRRWRRLRLDDVGRLTVSIAKVRPFITTDDWRPVALLDRADLGAMLKPPRDAARAVLRASVRGWTSAPEPGHDRARQASWRGMRMAQNIGIPEPLAQAAILWTWIWLAVQALYGAARPMPSR